MTFGTSRQHQKHRGYLSHQTQNRVPQGVLVRSRPGAPPLIAVSSDKPSGSQENQHYTGSAWPSPSRAQAAFRTSSAIFGRLRRAGGAETRSALTDRSMGSDTGRAPSLLALHRDAAVARAMAAHPLPSRPYGPRGTIGDLRVSRSMRSHGSGFP